MKKLMLGIFVLVGLAALFAANMDTEPVLAPVAHPAAYQQNAPVDANTAAPSILKQALAELQNQTGTASTGSQLTDEQIKKLAKLGITATHSRGVGYTK